MFILATGNSNTMYERHKAVIKNEWAIGKLSASFYSGRKAVIKKAGK